MTERSPIERFYDDASQYVERKLGMVSSRLSRSVILDVIANLPLGERPWRILDAGGGGGLYASPLARQGHEVCIVDISAGMLRLASEYLAKTGVKNKVQLVKADICDLDVLAGREFDLVLAIGDVLSYCEDAEQAVRGFYDLTRPGGMLFLDVESRFGGIRSGRRGRTLDDIYGAFVQGRSSPTGEPDVPIRLFEPSELRLILDSAGWRIVHQWPGAICWALLGSQALQEFGQTDQGYARLLEMEHRLRKESGLLAAGGDLQLLAVR